MSGRGEDQFRALPGFAARLYDGLTRARAIEIQVREIALAGLPIWLRVTLTKNPF